MLHFLTRLLIALLAISQSLSLSLCRSLSLTRSLFSVSFFNNPSPNTAAARFVSRRRFSCLVSSTAVLISITASTLASRNDQTENETGRERGSGFFVARIAFFNFFSFFFQISKCVMWQRPSADLPARCLWLESCSLPLVFCKRVWGGLERRDRLGTQCTV